MKLELKHLAGYLPYKLKGIMYYGGCDREDVELGLMDIPVWLNGSYPIKPILRPLSDLTKEIEANGEKFVPIQKYNYLRFEEISNYRGGSNTLNFIQVREQDALLELHFDIDGLIEAGLAIDINTL